MVQSIFPLSKGQEQRNAAKPSTRLGPEIALPLTLLAFILLGELSPMMKSQIERVVNWLCDHEMVASALEIAICCIPVWMLSVIAFEKVKSKKR